MAVLDVGLGDLENDVGVRRPDARRVMVDVLVCGFVLEALCLSGSRPGSRQV